MATSVTVMQVVAARVSQQEAGRSKWRRAPIISQEQRGDRCMIGHETSPEFFRDSGVVASTLPILLRPWGMVSNCLISGGPSVPSSCGHFLT